MKQTQFLFYILLLIILVNTPKSWAQVKSNVATPNYTTGGGGSTGAPVEGYTITNAIPASADAAALGKYGSIPVSPYTGVPNISIPLYTIKSGDLTLPISLSYHSSGIKVEEMASSVGLGWVLNAGGVITRTVRGMADEATYGFLDPMHYVPNIIKRLQNDNSSTFSAADANTYINAIGSGTMDGEPDMYNFNFGGYSGKFVMDSYGNINTIPQQNIVFKFTNSNPITSFTATTPDGVTYTFGTGNAYETTTSSTDPHAAIYYMSWFLTKIESPSFHEIDFSYTPDTYSQTQVPSQTLYTYIGGDNPSPRNDPSPIYLLSNITFHTVRLNSITFDNGTLTVNADSVRKDINSKFINAVTIANTTGSFSKKYNLYYTNSANSRLRLDSLIGQLEPIGTNSYKKEKYSFQYTPDAWRPITSNFVYGQDWWGYDNGQGNFVNGQETLVPRMFGVSVLGNLEDLPGADRDPNAATMGDGMLTQITYPTGGYTKFNYEPNQESNYIIPTAPYTGNPQMVYMSNDPASIYNNGLKTIALNIQGNPQVPVPVTFQVSGTAGSFQVTASLRDSTNTNLGTIWNTADSVIRLMPGRYAVTIQDPKNQTDTTRASYCKYQVVARWQGPAPTDTGRYHNYAVGGMRIRQIADYDGVSPKPYNVKSYLYTMPGNPALSSGYLSFLPNYSYTYYVDQKVVTGSVGYVIEKMSYLARTAVSNYPLATTQGEVVGYSYVQELLSGNLNGKNDYYYTTAADFPDLINDFGFPFSPAADQDWHRGLLEKEVNYKKVNGTYFKVQDRKNTYVHTPEVYSRAIKAGFNPVSVMYDQTLTYYNNVPATGDGKLLATFYADATDFNYLSADTTRTYDSADTTKFVTTTNNYQYDPTYYQLTQIKSNNSKNEIVTQNITYPFFYQTFANPSNGSLVGVQNLSNMYISSWPIEEITQKSNADGSNLRTTKAVLTTYKPNRAYRDSVYVLCTVNPLSTFTVSQPGTNTVIKDSHYQPVVSFDKYDLYGNILQEKKVGDALHTFIWGYPNVHSPHYNTMPVAEVTNADSANIAYTNFESYDPGGTGAGNWVYTNTSTTDVTAPMGAYYFAVSSTATIKKTGLVSATKYVVSFWSKSGSAVTVTGGTVTNVATGNSKSGWYYHEYSVTGTTSVTIGGTGQVDELRLYPAGALMTTYTYIPLVGMASKCDTKNDITYYTFDNVGRLSQVQDQNRNILKDYQYNYAIPELPAWVDMGVKRCVQSAGVNTGEEQMEQVDNNPYSSTYQQTQWRSMGTQTTDCPLPPMPVFVKMRLVSSVNTSGTINNTYEADSFSDAACTLPYNVPATTVVNYKEVTTIKTTSNGTTTTNTATGNYTATIAMGTNFVTIGPIAMNSCSGNDQAMVIQAPATMSSNATAQPNTAPGGGTTTSCSTVVSLLTGTGYTAEY